MNYPDEKFNKERNLHIQCRNLEISRNHLKIMQDEIVGLNWSVSVKEIKGAPIFQSAVLACISKIMDQHGLTAMRLLVGYKKFGIGLGDHIDHINGRYNRYRSEEYVICLTLGGDGSKIF